MKKMWCPNCKILTTKINTELGRPIHGGKSGCGITLMDAPPIQKKKSDPDVESISIRGKSYKKKMKASSILRIIIVIIFIFPAGLFLLVMNSTMVMVSGEGAMLFDPLPSILGLIFLFIGLICVLFPREYKLQYLIATILSLIAIVVISITLTSFLPEVKEQVEMDDETSIYHGVTGILSEIVDFAFLEYLLITTIIIFILVAIISIYIYVKSHFNENKSKVTLLHKKPFDD